MATVQRNTAYALTSEGETEMKRLVGIADFLDPHVRDGLRRTDLGPGGRAIDVGCGALGALLTLSDVVGPAGVVVGLDQNETALATARAVLDRHGREHVRLLHANISTVDPAELCPPGPYDVAYLRLFLIHQPDPAAALRKIANLLRPGGYVVVQDLYLGTPWPDSVPPIPATHTMAEWVDALLGRRGAAPRVGSGFRALCREAGLEEVSQRCFTPTDIGGRSAEIVQLLHDSVAAIRTGVVAAAVATDAEVEAVLGEFRAAQTAQYEVVHASLYAELVAHVPASP